MEKYILSFTYKYANIKCHKKETNGGIVTRVWKNEEKKMTVAIKLKNKK